MLISRNFYKSRTDTFLSWLFILPVFVILLIAAFIPLGYGLVFSFYRFKLNIAVPPLFIGFENYTGMFSDKLFIQSVTNNILFALLSVSLEMLIGIIIAMMLSDDNKLSRLLVT
ncbi:MAG: sugar ABC transporter permease, partial [Spirochaetota bacterium]